MLGFRKGLTVVVSCASLILGIAESGRSREVADGDLGRKLDEYIAKLRDAGKTEYE